MSKLIKADPVAGGALEFPGMPAVYTTLCNGTSCHRGRGIGLSSVVDSAVGSDSGDVAFAFVIKANLKTLGDIMC